MASGPRGSWSEWPVDHFLRTGSIGARDGAAVRWFHAANSRARAAEAARSDVHMVEVDVQLRGGHEEPVLAHPPDTDSDITLQEWLAQVASTAKGIKLDFKSLAAVGPSLELLGRVGPALASPVWLNGDVLPGPCGSCAPLDARAFLRAVTASCPEATLSLGWTTAWQPGQGYRWPMVQEMSQLCQPLSQPVTFAVRAALLPSSIPQLQWLLQQSHSHTGQCCLLQCPQAHGAAPSQSHRSVLPPPVSPSSWSCSIPVTQVSAASSSVPKLMELLHPSHTGQCCLLQCPTAHGTAPSQSHRSVLPQAPGAAPSQSHRSVLPSPVSHSSWGCSIPVTQVSAAFSSVLELMELLHPSHTGQCCPLQCPTAPGAAPSQSHRSVLPPPVSQSSWNCSIPVTQVSAASSSVLELMELLHPSHTDTPSLSGQERKMCILWKTCSSSEKTLIKVGFITTFLSHRTLNSKKPLESNAECRAGNAWPCHALYCEPL
ncbi:protein FAM151B isoform X3 [Catharus ustulatus]|uniref:protein FAM151B isoform X3 n=1 Tax=Catharus ustulatus TaxID=91951 RepID=UPI00140BE3D3|nr:protein FAM151B isoform X3 [Catharus ustulatus]